MLPESRHLHIYSYLWLSIPKEGGFPDWFTLSWMLVLSFIPLFAGFIGLITLRWERYELPKALFFISLMVFGSIVTEDTISNAETFTWFRFYSMQVVLPVLLSILGLAIVYLNRNSPEAELEKLRKKISELLSKDEAQELLDYLEIAKNYNEKEAVYKDNAKVRKATMKVLPVAEEKAHSIVDKLKIVMNEGREKAV
jgi:hypothetical protein